MFKISLFIDISESLKLTMNFSRHNVPCFSRGTQWAHQVMLWTAMRLGPGSPQAPVSMPRNSVRRTGHFHVS